MAALLDASLALLDPDLVARSATGAGVPPDAMQCALGAAVPLVLAAMATRAHDPALLARLAGMVANADAAPGHAAERASTTALADDGTPDADGHRSYATLGASLRETLFGGRDARAAAALGALVGAPAVGEASLTVAGGVVLAAIARTLAAHDEGFGGLAARLAAERDEVLARTAPVLVPLLGDGVSTTDRVAGA